MDPLSVLIFIILIALSAFFSGSEIALMTTSKHAVSSLVREKRFGAESLEKIKENTDKLLITILIGNNIVNTATASYATLLTTNIASKNGLFSPETGIAIATAVVTILLLLFGEITPKTICTRHNIAISLMVAPIYRVLMFVLTPISFLIEYFVKGVSFIFGGNYDKKISYQEVEAFIDMSHEEGEVEDDERRQMKNLLSLRDMYAESVMTPRVNVNFLHADMTVSEACKYFLENSHSRMPVAGENTDDVDFVMTIREAMRLEAEGAGDKKLSEVQLDKIMKIPLTHTLDVLFEKFQKSRRHIALVFDEFGGTAGIVTMEDILEEVFGDIKDETDKEEIFIKKKTENTIEAVGSVLIDDILDEFHLRADDLEIPSEYMNETLAYILMAETESLPTEGVEISFTNEEIQLSIMVLSVHDNVIEKVECRKTIIEKN